MTELSNFNTLVSIWKGLFISGEPRDVVYIIYRYVLILFIIIFIKWNHSARHFYNFVYTVVTENSGGYKGPCQSQHIVFQVAKAFISEK